MSKPTLALIVAIARNRVIGRDNTLPWKLPDDLKRFKALTSGHFIIMGRKTWDSLGRPLPQRRNIVITRQSGFVAEGAKVVHSLKDALALCAHEERAFLIGGAQLYEQALDQADELYLTEIHAEVSGDAFFPAFTALNFRETRREPHQADERNEFSFDFVEYVQQK